MDKPSLLALACDVRIYEIYLRSGARVEITAAVMREPDKDNRICFFRDPSLKQMVAYFNREDIAGISFGQENSASIHNRPPR